MTLEARIAAKLAHMDTTMIGLTFTTLMREMAKVAIAECHGEVMSLLRTHQCGTFITQGIRMSADALIPSTEPRRELHEPS